MGRAQATIILPPWPGECRRPIPHAAVAEGDMPVVVLRRERAQLDYANDTLGRCASHYDALKSGIEAR